MKVSLVRQASRIANPRAREAVLQGKWTTGPPSLKTRKAKMAYSSPIGLGPAFDEAMKILESHKQRHLQAAERLTESLDKSQDEGERKQIQKQIVLHQVRAEQHDPEVQYNHRINQPDLSQPVFRYLAQRAWKDHDMLVMLQRLETLHVLPDTLPTLEPQAAVRLQFPGVVNKWVEPGAFVQSMVSSRAPLLKVQTFDGPSEGLYTVLIVDPDTPDLENDTFKTTLHWAVANVPLSHVNHDVNVAASTELVPYLPPHPEKNTPAHRYCVWVLRQSQQLAQQELERDRFDIREFVHKHSLEAVGAHVWRGRYDQTTDAVRAKFGLGPGRTFSRVRNEILRQSISRPDLVRI